MKYIYAVFFLTSFGATGICQKKVDTIKIRYLVWDVQVQTTTPVLKQKEGFVVKFHSDQPLYLRKQDDNEDILFLDEKLKKEKGVVVKYSIYYF